MISNIFKKNIIKKIWKEINNYEGKRQYLQHIIVCIACNNKLFLSPTKIKDNYIFLNLGSGYSFWSRDILNVNKDIFYLIIDIDINKYYTNFETIVEPIFDRIDLKNSSLKYKDDSIDFIYQRDMISVYKNNEWDNIIEEVYRTLRKNSYFEFVEYDVNIYHDNLLDNNFSSLLFNNLTSSFKNNGYVYDITELYTKIKKIFINSEINHIEIKLPLYNEKKFNNLCTKNAILGLKHIESDLNTFLIKYEMNFEQSLGILKEEWNKNKSYMKLHILYGKK